MSKYNKLFEYIINKNQDKLVLSFIEIENILSFKLDHSFLNEKKYLEEKGYIVKISLKKEEMTITKKPRIKNIILDVGKVVVTWTPEEVASMLKEDDSHAQDVLANSLFRSKEWYRFDLGVDPQDVIIKDIEKTVSDSDKYLISYGVNNFSKVIRFDKDVCDWAFKMKEKGYNIYLLTNYGIVFKDTLNRMPIKDILSGYICSSYEKMMKPDLRIYKLLLDRYNLDGNECIFIDDVIENTKAARKAGIKYTHTFKGNIKELIKLNL